MASSSSSSTMVTLAAYRYDVFISFNDEDTRLNFTDHLYARLKALDIITFRDKEAINRGEEVKLEIKKAIQGSEASIVVLSKNYATSTWCLDELVLILQQRRDRGQFVLPVFYNVEPSDVRNQKNSYAIKVDEASPKWTIQNVYMWKKALWEVAHLSGEVQSGSKYEILDEIIDVIYRKVGRKQVTLPHNLIGMTSLDKEIVSWLEGSNAEHLAICGMAGRGKTTLAKYLYNSMSKRFENVSFIEDIDRTCEESNGLGKLQRQLLNDLSGGMNRSTRSVSQRTRRIEEALQRKKALIVLDDVAKKGQLVDLLGTQKINSQSMVIITTRVLDTEKWLDSKSYRFQEYKMRQLNFDESRELLCRQAFKSEKPKEGFTELVVKALDYCEGNPLALEVLASSLSTDNSIKFWRSILKTLEREVDNKIQRVLIQSYNTLPFDSNKKLFLHIACFFVGKDKDYVEQVFDDDCYICILWDQNPIQRIPSFCFIKQ